jgi:SAM-dependent methyltransferase
MTELFDEYADNYGNKVAEAISFSGCSHDFFTELKANDILGTAAAKIGPLNELTLLDVGCGIGETDRYLIPHVKTVHGVDVSEDSVTRAKVVNPAGSYQAYAGDRLPLADGSVDMAFAICVMHHVPPPQWASLVAEMRRVVRPGGLVAIYEHNPFNPFTRMVVNRCEFDRDAVLLSRRRTQRLICDAGMDVVSARDILFFPFRGRLFRLVEHSLGWMPMGAQYMVAGRVVRAS